MRASTSVVLAAVAVLAGAAWGQPGAREPHIGYLYPSGGQQGTVFNVLIGGQSLRGAKGVHISGEGVQASVVKFYRPVRNLDAGQRRELQRRLVAAWERRWAELFGEDTPPPLPATGLPRGPAKPRNAQKTGVTEAMEPVTLPEHPLLDDLDNRSLRELEHVVYAIKNFRKKQVNAQLAEMVMIEVSVASDAPPGDRELRLGGPRGLTNPLCFQVGPLPEVRELEPNDPKAFSKLVDDPPLDLPVVLNGQIEPGDVDRFRFRARKGQPLVIVTQARRLVPYLADAVPGWFQATVTLYDAKGNEVAFADDFRFDPDPVLYYEIPNGGVYTLEIRDAIYRGREDFVYRVAVGELPFITRIFPLGAPTESTTTALIGGWNLGTTQLPLDTQPGDRRIRQAALPQDTGGSNSVPYAVDTLAEGNESEPNDSKGHAQPVDLPLIVNGRIAQPGDVDVFCFEGHAGERVVAEVVARRLHSPVDSLLRLTDSSDHVLAWNDDSMRREDGYLYPDMGLLTHHADSYLTAQLPQDGSYYVHLADAQQHGGEAYAYRLRIAPPQPDFALHVTPSSINVPAGRAAELTVYALRKDGFDGGIHLTLRNASTAFTLNGGRIPAGHDRIRITVSSDGTPLAEPAVLHIEGRAQIGTQTVRRLAQPADDMMQAFLYRHLAPAQELLATVIGPRRPVQPVALASDDPVQIPVGGAARVTVSAPNNPRLAEVQFALSEAPPGLSIEGVETVSDGVSLLLKADGESAQPGYADNLIVKIAMEREDSGRRGPTANQKRLVPLGLLPAIPFETVAP